MTRRREPYIKRDFRNCDIHGLTEFSGSNSGESTVGQLMRCMACLNDKAKTYYANVKAGKRTVKPRSRVEVRRPICTGCRTEMPFSGVCDTC